MDAHAGLRGPEEVVRAVALRLGLLHLHLDLLDLGDQLRVLRLVPGDLLLQLLHQQRVRLERLLVPLLLQLERLHLPAQRLDLAQDAGEVEDTYPPRPFRPSSIEGRRVSHKK